MSDMYSYDKWLVEKKDINFPIWVLNQADKNPSIYEIIDEYLGERDPTVNLESALRSLNKAAKADIKQKIIQKVGTGSSKSISASTQSVSRERGKSLFKLLVKSLGLDQDLKVKKKPKEGWVCYYLTKKIRKEKLAQTIRNFPSLIEHFDKIPPQEEWVKVFWGVRNSGLFSYGYSTEETTIIIQDLPFNGSFYNYISSLGYKALWQIKRDFMGVEPKKYSEIFSIKTTVDNLGIVASRKYSLFDEYTLQFGYYGMGVWHSGELEPSSFFQIKKGIKTLLKSYSWSNKMRISITSKDFWVYVHLKKKADYTSSGHTW
jgi:hypothetical protein